MNLDSITPTRRNMMTGTLGLAAATAAVGASTAQAEETAIETGDGPSGGYVKSKDGTAIFYKDWGPKSAQPIVFHHGWPLSGDDWDAQMLFFRQGVPRHRARPPGTWPFRPGERRA